VQSEFNLVFLFVSYNIFLSVEKWNPPLRMRSVTPSAAAPSRVGVDESEVGPASLHSVRTAQR
jgi:hypothetical protein